MARIVIMGASDTSRAQLSRLLASSGHKVFRACATDGELRRTLSECEDGVVVFSGGTQSGLPADIAADFTDRFQLLLIARPDALAACESRAVFKLAYPCPGSAVIGKRHHRRCRFWLNRENNVIELAHAGCDKRRDALLLHLQGNHNRLSG